MTYSTGLRRPSPTSNCDGPGQGEGKEGEGGGGESAGKHSEMAGRSGVRNSGGWRRRVEMPRAHYTHGGCTAHGPVTSPYPPIPTSPRHARDTYLCAEHAAGRPRFAQRNLLRGPRPAPARGAATTAAFSIGSGGGGGGGGGGGKIWGGRREPRGLRGPRLGTSSGGSGGPAGPFAAPAGGGRHVPPRAGPPTRPASVFVVAFGAGPRPAPPRACLQHRGQHIVGPCFLHLTRPVAQPPEPHARDTPRALRPLGERERERERER